MPKYLANVNLIFPYLIVMFFPCLSWMFTFSGSARGRWYKFNDTVVEEFDMNDETLEYECFGGEYRPKVYDQCKQGRRVKNKKIKLVNIKNLF